MAGEDDWFNTGEPAPLREELEEEYLEQIETLYETARELWNGYTEDLRSSLGEIPDFYLEVMDQPNSEELYRNWYRSNLENINLQGEFAFSAFQAANRLREQYIKGIRRRARFKASYMRMFGAEQFDIDPDEPILEQVTVNEIVEDFWGNQVGRN